MMVFFYADHVCLITHYENSIYLVTTIYAISIPMMMSERQHIPIRPTIINVHCFKSSAIEDMEDTENAITALQTIYFIFI